MFSKLHKNVFFLLGFYASNKRWVFNLVSLLPVKREAPPEKWINEKTKICIDGFQRSGNTFFCYYFRKYNPNQHLAHHTHSLLQIQKAHASNLPLIITIRHPLESISSLVCYDKRLDIQIALSAYIAFYRGLLKISQPIYFDLSDHKETPWLLIEKINRTYNTTFEAPLLSKKELNAFIKSIPENIHSPSILSSSIPNKKKDLEKESIKQKLIQYKQYATALALYEKCKDQFL